MKISPENRFFKNYVISLGQSRPFYRNIRLAERRLFTDKPSKYWRIGFKAEKRKWPKLLQILTKFDCTAFDSISTDDSYKMQSNFRRF